MKAGLLYLFSGIVIASLLFFMMAKMVASGFAEVSPKSPVFIMALPNRTEIEAEHKTRVREEMPQPKLAKELETTVPKSAPAKLSAGSMRLELSGTDLALSAGLSGPDLTLGLGEMARGLTPLVYIPPQYPMRAKRLGLEGYVELEFTIDLNGQVQDVEVRRANPQGVFETEAIRAVRRWKFKPQLENGKPVAKRAAQLIKFSLEG